jgi:protein subunit release factor A
MNPTTTTEAGAVDVTVEIWPPRPTGGQHVGTGPDGVRVTHNPSGIQAFVDIGRSQHINKMIAMEMIEAAVTHPRYRGSL